MLDPALLRPGRFDRRVFVDLPDVKGREEILRIHVRKNEIKLSPDVDLPVIARGTPSFSGAELENLLNESALIAVRRDKNSVEMADIEEARDKVRWGRELKSRTVPVVDKRRTAYHEAGHALVTTLLTEVDPLHKVSIIPRGRAMGATLMLPKSDEFMLSRSKILQIITSLLAGRTAEKLMLGDISTGAQNDIERTTELARRMVCEWGMSDRLGPINFASESLVPGFEELGRSTNYSDRTAEIIDEEVNRIVLECQEHCSRLIKDNREMLVAIAEKLIEKETLSAEDVGEIIERESSRRGLDTPPMNIHLRQKSESETPLPSDPFKA
jgi:cell division protease FtsH